MTQIQGHPHPAAKGRLRGRQRYLFRFWQALLAEEKLPQCDRWIARQMKQHRQFGKQDRYWYSELLFAGLRFGYLAAFLEFLAQLSSGDSLPGPDRLVRAMEAFQKRFPDWAALKQGWQAIPPEVFFFWVDSRYRRVVQQPGLSTGLDAVPAATRHRRALFSAVEQHLPELAFPRGAMLWHGLPLWYTACVEERAVRSGWETPRLQLFLERQSFRPPLWLRLNAPEQGEQVLAELAASGFVAEADGLALKVRGQRGIFELQCYRKGWVEIQDWASQQLGRLVWARPGQMVWDCCAGGGGKTLQIATDPQGLNRRGAVYASDIREYKLKELLQRARRAQLPNIRVLPWDGNTLPAFGKEVEKRRGFHWVLVDAPCSATGTWRRNPDAKYRFHPSGLEEWVALQARLLSRAADAVRPGGRLVYATCSWLVQENEQVVQQFLADHPQFHLLEMQLFGNPDRDADTTFGAVLEKRT
ncbi:MAG: RsmB/NOP family class I SAM-dependent RNA methyltransferase [Calditrichaeota bacterium]|nr:MAG: RsmB/NOP family class I SAM-dependent RNA methyltransferase [Calditrichota bacterium]